LSKWTSRWPDSIVLNRLQVLATAAKDTLVSEINENVDFDPKVQSEQTIIIFRPDLDIYDVVIQLKSDQIVNQIQAIDFPPKFEFTIKKFDPEVNERLPIVDFDPVDRYVRQLRDSYGDYALFFYDRFGGREIGVLWRPSVFECEPFCTASAAKCRRMSGTAAANGVPNVGTNIDAIIEDFSILGDGIVRDVHINTHNSALN
ncbi:unnamed protein product, partial [Medioppia subpectinata]